MTRMRRLGVLQWVGVLGAALTWVGQHAVGQGSADAGCSAGGSHWGIANDTWQIALMVAACSLILASEAAAIVVFRATSGSSYESPPPAGRMRFFAIASMTANVIFLVIVLLDGIAATVDTLCRQS
jgi:hypothetical protein